MLCKNCGNTISDGAKFCGFCGHTIEPETNISESYEHNDNANINNDDTTFANIKNSPKTNIKINKAKSAHTKRGFGICFISILFSILLCITLLASSAVIIIRQSLSNNNIDQWIDEVKLTDIDISMITGNDENLVDYLYDYKDTIGWDNLTRNDIEKWISKPFISNFIKEMLSEYTLYIIDGNNSDGITSDAIIDFIKDNEKTILKLMSEATNKNYVSMNYEEVETNLTKYLGDTLSIREIDKQYSGVLSMAQFYLSSGAVAVLLIINGLIIIAITLINRKSIINSLLYIGVPSITLGAIFICSNVAIKIFFAGSQHSIIFTILNLILDKLLICGFVLLIIGCVMIVAKAIYNHIRLKILSKTINITN